MTPLPWKKLSSRDVVRDRWVRLRADRCEIAPGKIIEPYYVMEEPEWVHAIAFDAAQRVLLVHQYRHGAEAMVWELPGGAGDPGEDPLRSVQRELREETGAVADNWRPIGAFFANPARQTNRIHGFVAEHARILHAQDLDDTETIECRFFTVAEVLALIASGAFAQSMHVALFYRALAALDRLHVVEPGARPT